MIAVLYVQKGGAYYGLDDIDPWDETRDARLYNGPWPVIAHPPCARWCQLAGLVEAVHGYKRGDDGGTFASALAAVRAWGGVLEHPAYSHAWAAHDLNRPPRSGGWVAADFMGGWTCHVEQGRYGHSARKATWLYAAGCDLPSMRWGRTPSEDIAALVSGCKNHVADSETRPRLSPKQASTTPDQFRDVLISIAKTAKMPQNEMHLAAEAAERIGK